MSEKMYNQKNQTIKGPTIAQTNMLFLKLQLMSTNI